MGTLHCLCRLVVLLSLSVIRETVTSPNDQCQFIFKDDSVLQVALSQDAGAKVTMDLHAENKIKCAEACCESEGEWCTLAVFHTKTDQEAMNCFLVQCVPDGSENNVCVTKHVRRSGFISATVKHLTDQKPRLLDHLLYSKVDANHRVHRSLYPDLLQENLSRHKMRSHIRPVSSSSMSDSSVSISPIAPSASSRNIASSSSISVPQQSSSVSSVSRPSSSRPSSSPSSSRSASQSLSSPSSSTSLSLMLPSISPSLSSFMSSRSTTLQSHSISKTTFTSSFPFSNQEETISSSLSSSSAPPSSNTAPPPTSPAPSTTPSIPPPHSSSPDTPSISVNTSAPPLAPISPTTSPPHSSSDASSNAATSSSDVISANNSVEALNNLNAVINSSLTSPSSNPATTNVKPSPTTVADTDIPTPKPPKVQTTAKSSTKATTKPAEIADTTPAPKLTSPVSLTASQMSDSSATRPINATQSGQDGTESLGEIKHNINRTTVTQTGILIVTLCFGIIFLLAMMVVVGKRWCEGYQRRKYSKVDYLINGYYS